MTRLLRGLGALVFAAVLVAAGWWAGQEAFTAPEDPLTEQASVMYTVETGSVGRSLTFAAVAEWPMKDLGRGSASGTVTSIEVEPGSEVSSGNVLYTVNLRPVVIASGDVPSFRDLALRAEGPDVEQLQALLAQEGFFDDEQDGVFGSSTRTGVRDWQESLGLARTGVVRRGDVLFTVGLPARIVVASEIEVGAELTGGSVTVRHVVGEPIFVVPLSLEQRGLVPLSADIEVTHADGVWQGRISEAIEDDQQRQLILVLETVDGGALCGSECADAVPLEGRSDYTVKIVIVPETTGPLVAVAAIRAHPDGTAFVETPEGLQIPVTILAASNGLAVVDGIETGTVILLPIVEES